MKINAALAAAVSLFAASAAAAPRVLTDIAPVQSLVARVMDGAGAPEVLLPAGVSPHHYALRPSDARLLDEAELMIWVGEAMTPWLPHALERLGHAALLELIEAPGLMLVEAGDGVVHEDEHEHEHGGEASAHEDDEHAHGGEDRHGHDEQAQAEEDHHDHGAVDPHIWLDTRNAAAIGHAVAEALAGLDAANAALYRANAEAAEAEMATLETEIDAVVAPVRGRGYVMAHDALGYFEGRFDIYARGALSGSQAARPGPASAERIRALIETGEVVCVFTDKAHDSGLAARLAEGTDARVAALDPLGLGLTPGAALYPEMMRRLARDMAGCLRAE